MKITLLTFCLFLMFGFSSFAQEIANDSLEVEPTDTSYISKDSFTKERQIQWETLSHDFGQIEVYQKVNFPFKFTNVSKAPIIITDVKVTCGCTSPTWTQ